MPLDVVGDTSSYIVGTSIGIIVNNSPGAKEDDAFSEVGGLDGNEFNDTHSNLTRGGDETKISAVRGGNDVVRIYTGKIQLSH